MSGDEDLRRPAEPLEVTDEEVVELAGRRSKPVAAVARMRKQVPTEATGRLVSDAAAPARVSRPELTSMRRAGRRPDAVLKRLTPSDVPADAADARVDERVETPGRKPPAAKR